MNKSVINICRSFFGGHVFFFCLIRLSQMNVISGTCGKTMFCLYKTAKTILENTSIIQHSYEGQVGVVSLLGYHTVRTCQRIFLLLFEVS